MPWNVRFIELFDRCLLRHQAGERDFTSYCAAADLGLLSAIGCKPREFHDYVEDCATDGEPAPSTALLIAAVRRDFFLVQQQGVTSRRTVAPDDLPTFGDSLGGIPYLPRILAKARAKLRGELDPEIMFGCGGDRAFLHRHGQIHPADFLRHVWAAGTDDAKVLACVKQAAGL